MKLSNYLIIFLFFILFSSISRPPILISPDEKYRRDTHSLDPEDLKDEPEEKKEEIPTNWGGNTLTQEEKEIDGAPVSIFTLQGGAWIQHKTSRLSSSKIQIIGKDAIKGSLNGGVRVVDSENRVSLYASKAEYDKYAETIDLEGRPSLYYYDKENRKTKIISEKIKRFMAESKVVFLGRVIIENKDYTIISDSAIFWEKEKTLIMDDYPFIFGELSFLTGEKVIYNSEKNENKLEKDASLFKFSYESPRKKKDTDPKDTNPKEAEKLPKQKILSLFSGDKLINQGGDSKKAYIGMFGNARLYRPDSEFSADYVKAFGEKNQDIEAKNSVRFYDKENNMIILGNNFEHEKKTEYTHVTDKAKIEFLKKGTEEVTATLYAIEIERFGNRKEIVARGNISIETDKATAYGEYATFSETSKKLVIEGNPRLKRKNKILYCGKIVLYPESNRAFITDGIRVKNDGNKN